MISPAEWSRWNVSLRLAVAPAWPAEPVGGAQPATRRMRARTPLVLVACTVRITKRRQVSHSLAFGVDRLTATCLVIAPVRDQAPTQRVERHISSLVIAADDQQFLAGRGVPPPWLVVHTAIPHVDAIDAGIAQRPAALDDPPSHVRGRLPSTMHERGKTGGIQCSGCLLLRALR